jgi:hypothetical protein
MKGNLRGWLILGGLLLGPHAPTRAQEQDRVVLLEDPAQPPRPGLSQALRIQLLEVAAVEVRQWPETPGVSGRVQLASQVAAEPGTLVVVWAEPTVELPNGSSEAVLYVVGRAQGQGRAQVEIVRVSGEGGPDMDRSLAIKVGEVVHEVRTQRAQAASLEPPPAPPPVAAPPPAPTKPAPARAWGLTAALGAVAGPLSGSELGQWGVRAGAGAAYRSGGARFAGLAEISWLPPLRITSGDSQVQLDELGPGLLARAQLREGRVWLGLRAGAGLSWIEAEGQSLLARGTPESLLVATWLLGFDTEIEILGGVGLLAALELQGREPRRRFTVERERVVDLGRLRPLGLIALTFHDERVR